jgi:hypothetical protein
VQIGAGIWILNSRTMSNLEFREVKTREDWELAVSIRNLCSTYSPGTVEQALESQSLLPEGAIAKRRLVEREGVLVGYFVVMEAFWLSSPGRFENRLFMVPEHETPELYDQILAETERMSVELGAKKTCYWERTIRPDAMACMAKRGYAETQRNPQGFVSPGQVDYSAFQEKLDLVTAEGFTIKSLEELSKEDPLWERKYYDLNMDVMADVPLPDPFAPIPYEDFLKDIKTMDLHCIMVAISKEGDWAALSAMDHNRVNPKVGNTLLTGVRRAFRRKSLATAVKVVLMQRAKNLGIEKIYTDNEEDNPMFLLNKQLGFVEEFQYVCFEREV